MARLSMEGRAVHVLLIADGETARLPKGGGLDAKMDGAVAHRNQAADNACRILGCASVETLGLADNRLDGLDLLDVVRRIEAFLRRIRPTMVFTHHAGDVNVDHRVVHDAVIAACRPQSGSCVAELLFFEVPSSTEWRPPGSGIPFVPNWFVDISTTLKTKLEALLAYQDELRAFPHPRSVKAVEALAQWRGATAGMLAAEAFMLGRKLTY